MNQPLLSICIPTYNRDSLLWKTLNSITTQKVFLDTYDIEIIISNNASTDATDLVCNEFIKKYPDKIKYFKHETELFADKNILFAIQQGSGKFLKLNNDSFYFNENSLEQMISNIKQALDFNAKAVFFSNGQACETKLETDFNSFLKNVSYILTWIGAHCYEREFFNSLKDVDRCLNTRLNQVDIIGRIFEQKHSVYIVNNAYLTGLYQEKKGGYNSIKVFGYNYFYILEQFKNKGLISNKIWNREKYRILFKHLFNNNYIEFSKKYKIDEEEIGFFKYLKYYWFSPILYFAFIKLLFLKFEYNYKKLKSKKRKRKTLSETERIYLSNNIDNNTKIILNGSVTYEKIAVGKKTYGNVNALFSNNIPVLLIIGNYVSIGPDVKFIVNSEHDYKNISTFPFKVLCNGVHCEALTKGSIIVEDDVWIGANSLILSGVRIGQGAVVTSGSVVTKDVEPYSIVGGNPAKRIKYRFNSEIIQKLKEFNIGALDQDTIKKNIKTLYTHISDNNIDNILKLLKGIE